MSIKGRRKFSTDNVKLSEVGNIVYVKAQTQISMSPARTKFEHGKCCPHSLAFQLFFSVVRPETEITVVCYGINFIFMSIYPQA